MKPLVAFPEVVRAAAELGTIIADAADTIELAGRLPEAIVERLTDSGLNHLYLPASAGGPEVDPISAFLAVEHLARADGSVAWCAQVSTANSWQIAALHPAAVALMQAAPASAMRFSGSARPLGRAVRVDGGYRVTGRWDFASNCLHADWYCGACIAEEDGRRRVRAVVMPIGAGRVIETWQVTGLRGSGSHDFAVQDVFVSDEFVSAGRHLSSQNSRLYRQRLTMVVNWAPTAAVALGIARGALDAFSVMASHSTAGMVDVPLRDRAEAQQAVGRASAMLGAARTYCLDTVAAAWEAADAEPAELDPLLAEARLAIPHAMHAAVDIVNLLFHAGGTRSIFACHTLERRFRDAQVAVRHGAGSTSHFEAGGRVKLGLPAGAPFW